MKTICIWLLICSVVTEYAYSAELPKSDEYFDKENSIEENNEQLIESNNEKNKRRLYLLTTARLDSLALQGPPTSACGGPGDYCDESMLCCKGYECVTRSAGPDYPVCTAINRKLHVSKTRHRQSGGKKMKAQRKINHNARWTKFQDPSKTGCGGPGDLCNTSMPCCYPYFCVCVMDRPDECTGGSRRPSHVSKIRQHKLNGKTKLNSTQRNINLNSLALQDPPKTDCGVPGDNCSTSMPCCEPFKCASDEGGSDTVCKAFGRRSSHVSKIREHKPDGKKKLNSTQRNTNLNALALQDPPKTDCGKPGDNCNTSMPCCEPFKCASDEGRSDTVCKAFGSKSSHASKIRELKVNGKKKLNSTQRSTNLNALAFQDPPKTDCGKPGDNCNTSMPCCEPFKCSSDEGGSDTVCKAFGSRSSHTSKIREHKPDGKKKLNSTQPFVNLNALAFQDPPPTTNCSDAGAFCNTTMLCCEGYACVVVGSFPVCAAISL